MDTHRVLLLAAILLTTPLLGCIGNEEDPVEQQNLPGVGDLTTTPEETSIYTADGNLVGTDALPDGVPAPKGLQHLTGFENFEPTIGVTSDGTLFMSNIGGTPGTGWSSIIRSTDQGRTWEDVTNSVGPATVPAQSNDPYVYVDEATDRVYNLDMQGLSCNVIQWSDDKGETWTVNPLGCGATPLLDHPTLWAGQPTELTTIDYENVVYLCVNRVGDSACSVSLDGGMSFSPFTTVFEGVNTEGELCGGLHAHGVSGPDGRAFLPKGQCGTPMVAYTDDNGLTWEQVTISQEVSVPGHEVALAVDDQSNVFAFWMSDDRKPYLAVSTDNGETWGTPMMVAPKDVTITRFPTIAAGDDGQVAMAYIGTTTSEDQEDMDGDDTWNAYITTSLDATASNPVFATTTANDPKDPIARGPCEGRCDAPEGGGNIGDFIDVVIDDNGRPWAALADICTQDCTDPAATENDVGVGFVGTLSQGPGLVSSVTRLPPLGLGSSSETQDEGAGDGTLIPDEPVDELP